MYKVYFYNLDHIKVTITIHIPMNWVVHTFYNCPGTTQLPFLTDYCKRVCGVAGWTHKPWPSTLTHMWSRIMESSIFEKVCFKSFQSALKLNKFNHFWVKVNLMTRISKFQVFCLQTHGVRCVWTGREKACQIFQFSYLIFINEISGLYTNVKWEFLPPKVVMW